MENKNIEPVVTELGLTLGCSGHSIERRSSSSNDLGAGANANAASRINITCLASDPLSEIVWLPNKGLCLKCTECSFSKHKHSLVWGAGASNALVRSSQQMNTSARSSNEKPIDEQNIYTSSSTFPDLNTKVSDIDNSDQSPAQNDLQGLSDDEFVPTSKKSGSKSVFEAEKNSQTCGYRRKGKEKALSDGDVKGMVSKSEDSDSHESVESCDSAALFSTGKKRWGFEQKLIVGSKRVKKQIDENPCSSSFVKQDSSFMNWISNMMKGFPKSKDEIPSLALTTDASTNRSDDNIGFQSIFHSIYSPKAKVQGTPQDENDGAGLELITNKICDLDATPIAWHGENFNFLNAFNERFKRPKNSSMTLSPSKRSSEGNIAENMNSCNLPVDVEKDRASSSSSLGKRKMNTENIDSDPPLEAKMARNIGHKSDPLGSLWITRFTPKASSSLLNQDSGEKNNVNVSNNLETVETRQQCPEEPLTSLGKEITIAASSLRSKDSELMASLFARRLDAFKHIMPSGVSENRTSSTVTCFFCGKKGHHLQYCPEITDNEIEHLLRNMKSSNTFNELPRICVRCFEHDHWAVTCPTVSIGQPHPGCTAASLASFEENTKLLDQNREAIAGRTIGIDTGKGTNTLYKVVADKMKSNTNVNKKYSISSSKEMKPWGNNFINSNTPKAIFDAVRMLRLSRTDIVKWKTSQSSVSHLKGFFLRLRLAKWEKGLGGTGYYVACITEAKKQGTQQNSEKSIAVNVGGIGCLVESQYISNHDFLDDELTAWFWAIEKNGGKIPSEEELTVKVKERRMLGF